MIKVLYVFLTLVVILVVGYFNGDHQGEDNDSSDQEKLEQPSKAQTVERNGLPKNLTADGYEDLDLKVDSQSPTPQESYSKYIDAASEGDHTAQYRVAMAINECFWKEQPTALEIESTLDQISAVGVGLSEEEIDLKRKSAKDCEQIYLDNPDKNLIVLQDAWLNESASNGSPFAFSELAIREIAKFEDPEFSEKFKLKIKEGLEQSLNDKSLIDKALDYGHIYRINLYQPSDNEESAGSSSIATRALWIARCYNRLSYFENCMSEVKADHELDSNYYLDQNLSLSSKLAKDLLKRIESGDLANFDLDETALISVPR